MCLRCREEHSASRRKDKYPEPGTSSPRPIPSCPLSMSFRGASLQPPTPRLSLPRPTPAWLPPRPMYGWSGLLVGLSSPNILPSFLGHGPRERRMGAVPIKPLPPHAALPTFQMHVYPRYLP